MICKGGGDSDDQVHEKMSHDLNERLCHFDDCSRSLNVPQKPSPTTPLKGRKLKAPGSDSDPLSSPNPSGKTHKERSPKVGRRSPRSPGTEKKRSSREAELEAQLAQLQEELKQAKDHLSSSETWKKMAQEEAEEAKKQLTAMSTKLEETQKQLKELSDCEEARVQELRKVSQDRDRVGQSELEALRKQQSMESATLASALSETQRLKNQLDSVSEYEASQTRCAEAARAEIQSLRVKFSETLELVEELKNQLNDSRESESQTLEEVLRVQMLLEVVKTTEETLRMEQASAKESYKSLLVELEQSKNRVKSLEELVSSLQADLANISKISAFPSDDIKALCEKGACDQSERLKTELNNLKHEASELREALKVAEERYHDQCLQSTLWIRNTYELVEHAKSESHKREAELEVKLKESRVEVEELKTKLIQTENALERVSHDSRQIQKVEQNKSAERETVLELELKKSESVLEELKASVLDKEMKLQSITEENETLKSEIIKRETERSKASDEALALAEAARAAEWEALMKLGYLTEEADKSSRKAARVTEQLDAAQAANSEMEAELRRMKVQTDQWRKASEAAVAMLSVGNNGKYVERTGSLDYNTIGGMLGSPYFVDIDDDLPKKKNGNMLKKIGSLLRKGQK